MPKWIKEQEKYGNMPKYNPVVSKREDDVLTVMQRQRKSKKRLFLWGLFILILVFSSLLWIIK